MTDFRRDTVFGKDGKFHDVRLVAGTTQLALDGVPVAALKDPAIGCRMAVDKLSRQFVLLPTNGWQVLRRYDGSEIKIQPWPNQSGNYGLAALRQMDDNCEVYIRAPSHDGGATCQILVYNIDGWEIRRIDGVPYSGNGILYIDDATGKPYMVDQPAFSDHGGVTYRYFQSKAGWGAGQLQTGLPEGGQGVIKPDQSQWVTWPDLTNQQPSYLAANGDKFQLAIQGNNTPEPSQVALTPRGGAGRVITITGPLKAGDVIKIV